MRVRRLVVTSALLAATAVTGAACGSAPEGPGGRVSFQDALETTLGGDSLGVRLAMVGAPGDVADFISDDYTSAEDTTRNAAILLDSALDAAYDDDGDFSLDARVGGIDHAAEMRGFEKNFFARGDVVGIAGLFAVSRSDVQGTLATLSQVGMGALADAIRDGKWISADASPLASFMNGMGIMPAGATGLLDMGAQSERTLGLLPEMFEEAATVEFAGTDGTGHHYRVDVSTRKAFTAVMPLLRDLYGEMIPAEDFPAAADVPDDIVKADAWVSGGRLTRVEIDLTQFKPGTGSQGPVSIRLDVDRDPGDIPVPADAVEVDLVKLFASFTGISGETETGYAEGSGEAGPSIGYGYEPDAPVPNFELVDPRG